MGAGASLLEDQLPCCSDKPIAYNDRQLAELELHQQQLGLTNKQMWGIIAKVSPTSIEKAVLVFELHLSI